MSGGSRNASANKELTRAKAAYENCTSQREKWRIEELEAMVNEEEKSMNQQELVKEVNWVQDPDTVTTRATQFVRTQAEMWRLKMMLAKAISMQGDSANQLRQAQQTLAAANEEHAAILEGSDFKISSMEQQLDTISKKFTMLISLMRHTINQEGRAIRETSGGSKNTNDLPSPSQVGQAKASNAQEKSKNYNVLDTF